MKIIIAADIFPPEIGGPATYSKKIAEMLSARGHHVLVLCYSNAKSTKDFYQFSVDRIRFSKLKIVHYCHYFLRLLMLARNADMIYAQGPVGAGLPAVIVGIILSKRVIIKVVGDYAWEQARGKHRTEESIDQFQLTSHKGVIGVLKKIERFTTKQATCIITPSRYLKSMVAGWNIKQEKIFVIYNAISARVVPRKVNKELDSIITMGRLVPWKGFETLISIMPELLKVNKKFRLLILGDGPIHASLQLLAHELHLDTHIKIKKVTPDERDYLLSEAKLFVLNSAYEGLSHALLEAMNAGVPIIATNVCGNPEVIENEKNGLLVPYNDRQALLSAIIRLWRDIRLQERFTDEGRRRVPEFSEERMIRETITLLENIKSLN